MRRIVRKACRRAARSPCRRRPSGDLDELEARLPSGRYRLWCSLPGHEQARHARERCA